ncbi:hypothetical protein [Proteus mirabilis]|uniref:hypothetical protein n=1 Tax=Proteus mirabilis TaxID=584 RepID=UPI000AD780B3|nr:hypothetical protein [Proteus mirabilis]NJJ92917.1 hypothetical protein [Proteus mirabilis]NJK07457.1 hypothetical protein [Proteus mirabilis]
MSLEAIFLLAERNEVKRILDGISWNDIIGKMTFTSRLMKVESQLRDLGVIF